MADWTQQRLNEADRRRLSRRLFQAERGSRIYRRRVLQLSPGLFGLLCIWTLVASDVSAPYMLIFWAGIGTLVTTWLYLESKFQEAKTRSRVEGAIMADSVRRIQVKAERLWVLYSSHQSKVYLCENEKNAVTSISSIDFQGTSSFPSLDFEFREILDQNGKVVETRLKTAGQMAEPKKIITCGKIPDEFLDSPIVFFDTSLEGIALKFGL